MCIRSNTETKQPFMHDNKLLNIKPRISRIYLNRSLGTTNTPGSLRTRRSGLNPCRRIPKRILLGPLRRLSPKLRPLLSLSLYRPVMHPTHDELERGEASGGEREEATRESEKQTERGWQGLRRREGERGTGCTEEEMGGRKEEELIVWGVEHHLVFLYNQGKCLEKW